MKLDHVLTRGFLRRASAVRVASIVWATVACTVQLHAATVAVAPPPPVHIAPVIHVAPTVRIVPHTGTLTAPPIGTAKPAVTNKYRTVTTVQTVPGARLTACNSKTPVGSKCLRGTKACTKAEGAFLDCPVP